MLVERHTDPHLLFSHSPALFSLFSHSPAPFPLSCSFLTLLLFSHHHHPAPLSPLSTPFPLFCSSQVDDRKTLPQFFDQIDVLQDEVQEAENRVKGMEKLAAELQAEAAAITEGIGQEQCRRQAAELEFDEAWDIMQDVYQLVSEAIGDDDVASFINPELSRSMHRLSNARLSNLHRRGSVDPKQPTSPCPPPPESPLPLLKRRPVPRSLNTTEVRLPQLVVSEEGASDDGENTSGSTDGDDDDDDDDDDDVDEYDDEYDSEGADENGHGKGIVQAEGERRRSRRKDPEDEQSRRISQWLENSVIVSDGRFSPSSVPSEINVPQGFLQVESSDTELKNPHNSRRKSARRSASRHDHHHHHHHHHQDGGEHDAGDQDAAGSDDESDVDSNLFDDDNEEERAVAHKGGHEGEPDYDYATTLNHTDTSEDDDDDDDDEFHSANEDMAEGGAGRPSGSMRRHSRGGRRSGWFDVYGGVVPAKGPALDSASDASSGKSSGTRKNTVSFHPSVKSGESCGDGNSNSGAGTGQRVADKENGTGREGSQRASQRRRSNRPKSPMSEQQQQPAKRSKRSTPTSPVTCGDDSSVDMEVGELSSPPQAVPVQRRNMQPDVVEEAYKQRKARRIREHDLRKHSSATRQFTCRQCSTRIRRGEKHQRCWQCTQHFHERCAAQGVRTSSTTIGKGRGRERERESVCV